MTERKTKNFSVSFKEGEPERLQKAVERLKKSTGFKISRNELIRKCALAGERCLELIEKGKQPNFEKIFKEVD